jgi:hypothetical protein
MYIYSNPNMFFLYNTFPLFLLLLLLSFFFFLTVLVFELVFARQALYHFSSPPAFLALGYFSDKVSSFLL